MRILSRRWGGLALVAIAFAAGCSGGSSSTPVQPIAPIVSSPTPGILSVTPTSLQFIDSGAGAAQTVTASENNFTGTFSQTSGNCAPSSGTIVTVTGPSLSGVFTVTPVNSGQCTFTVSDGDGQSEVVNVVVTLTNGTVKGGVRGGAR